MHHPPVLALTRLYALPSCLTVTGEWALWATCTTVGAEKMGDAHADSAVFFAFFARVAFGFAITLLFVILAINLLSTCNPRAYSQREVGRYLAVIVRTYSSRLLRAYTLDLAVQFPLCQLRCPDTKCLPAPLRLACCLWSALLHQRADVVGTVQAWYMFSCTRVSLQF
jgi:hypothetical protein